jgi:trans-aconitate methyltransferase
LDEVRNHFPPQELQIFDVGIGTGESINKKVTRLVQSGYMPHVRGIDPHIRLDTVKKNVSVPLEVYPMRFEDYTSEQTFHVVNATQSLYYLEGLEASLQKMVSMLQTNGLLLITVWSQACVLYRIHTAVFGKETSVVTAEDVLDELLKNRDVHTIRTVLCEAGVNLQQWSESPTMTNAALEIIARKVKHNINDEIRKQKLLTVLKGRATTEKRVNLMIIVEKQV